jgi:hypothetical protein
MTDLIACTRCSWLTIDPGHRCEQQLPLGDMLALPCTSCGTPSWYSYGLNRYLHATVGLPHGPCWLAIVRGDIDEDIERANVRAMMRHERRRRRGSAA